MSTCRSASTASRSTITGSTIRRTCHGSNSAREIARRPRTVYLLKEKHAPGFEQSLAACGLQPTRLGSVHADDNDLVLLATGTGAD